MGGRRQHSAYGVTELDFIPQLVAAFSGAAGAILVALVVVVRYLDRRDLRNKESFETLAGVYSEEIRCIIISHERTVERLVLARQRDGDKEADE